MNQNGFATVIIVVTGIVLAIVLLTMVTNYEQSVTSSILQANQNNTKTESAFNANYSPPPTPIQTPEPSPTLNTNGPTKVITVPINASKFEKDVIVAGSGSAGCGAPIGLVSYEDNSSESSMTIYSLLSQTDDSNPDEKYIVQGLASILDFLNGNDPKATKGPYFQFVFHYGCGGAAYIPVKVLRISYPNTDVAKLVIANGGQSAMSSDILIDVYAKKGNDLIKLSKFFNNTGLTKSAYDSCSQNPTPAPSGYNELNCYWDELGNDTKLQAFGFSEANKLISLFAIK